MGIPWGRINSKFTFQLYLSAKKYFKESFGLSKYFKTWREKYLFLPSLTEDPHFLPCQRKDLLRWNLSNSCQGRRDNILITGLIIFSACCPELSTPLVSQVREYKQGLRGGACIPMNITTSSCDRRKAPQEIKENTSQVNTQYTFCLFHDCYIRWWRTIRVTNLFIPVSLGLEQSQRKKEIVRPLVFSLLKFPE